MKSLCIKVRGGSRDAPWLSLGNEYRVLSILVPSNGSPLLRVIADDGRTPILVEAELFEMSSQRIPDNWVGVIREGGVVELGPESWLESGFWERYFDGDAAVVAKFEEEVRKMDLSA